MPAHRRVRSFLSSTTFVAPFNGTYSFFGIGAGGGGTMNVRAGGGAASAHKSVYMNKDDEANIGVGVGASDTDGGDSTVTINSSVVLKAVGGKRGGYGATNGGQASDCIGDVAYTGTNGQTGTGTTRRYGGDAAGSLMDGEAGGGNYFGGCSGNLAAITHRLYGSGGHSRSDEAIAGRQGVVMVYYNENITGYPTIKDWAYSRSAETGSTSHVINMPDASEGDLLLVMFSCDSINTRTYTPTSGWTLLGQQANSGTEAMRLLIYYKYATESDSLTITTNAMEGSTAIAISIREADVPTGSSVGGSSTNADPPNHSIGSSASCLWIAAMGRDLDTGGTKEITAPPSNYLDFHYLSPKNQINGADIAIATRHLNASSENPGAFTSDTEQWAAFTIAVKYKADQKKRRKIMII